MIERGSAAKVQGFSGNCGAKGGNCGPIGMAVGEVTGKVPNQGTRVLACGALKIADLTDLGFWLAAGRGCMAGYGPLQAATGAVRNTGSYLTKGKVLPAARAETTVDP